MDLSYIEGALEKQIMPFINNLIGPFSISYIQKQFLGFSTDKIHKALEKLTSQGEISLISKGEDPLTWVRTDLMPERGITWEEVSRQRVESWLTLHINTIKPFIEKSERAFTIQDIQRHFPRISSIAVESALDRLTNREELIFLYSDDKPKHSVWIKAEVLHSRGLTLKEALDEYYERHDNLAYSLKHSLSLNGRNPQGSIELSHGLKLNLTEKNNIMKVLFNLADSFEVNILSKEIKKAFREIITVHVDLGDAFLDLTQDIEEAYVSFLPRDALSMVWHTARLKERIPRDMPLNLSQIEDSANHIIELIDFIRREGGRSNVGESLNQVSEELDTWFSYWKEGETIFR